MARGSRDTRVKRGIALPLRAEGGRLVLSEGTEQLSKIIILRLMSSSCENPFLDLGGRDDVIFGTGSAAAQQQIAAKINNVFRYLEQRERARLVPGYPQFDSFVNGDMNVSVRYFDIEQAREEELRLGLQGLILSSSVEGF